jgi:hypothetical protein
MYRFIITVLFFIIGFPMVAFARPEGYGSATCWGGGSSNICQLVSSTVWDCALGRPGTGSYEGIAWVIYNGPTGDLCDTYDYCAWGTDSTGTLFYCEITDEDIRTVQLVGTEQSDALYFQYDYPSEPETQYDLDTHTAETGVEGIMIGNDGNDEMWGSRVDHVYYKDVLNGGAGGDDIRGAEGDDVLSGNGGEDYIHGDWGNDVIHGDEGDDVVWGGPGDDIIFGDSENDHIAGEDGDDTLHGGSGIDYLCGDDDSDTITGEGGNDVLWAGDYPEETESLNGGPHTSNPPGDYCQTDGDMTVVYCETTSEEESMARPQGEEDDDQCPIQHEE